MSKSYNNSVDPIQVCETIIISLIFFIGSNQAITKFGTDTLRYYFINSATYGADLNFSEAAMISMHNSELADTLGNLVHRGINLCVKYCDGIIPDVSHDATYALPFNLEALDSDIRADLETCSLNTAVFKAMDAVRSTNK